LVNAVPNVSGKPLRELLSLRGRAAVVTGAARGIGYATAARLIEAGARVVVADVDDPAARRAQTELGEAAVAAHVDVTDEGSLRDLAALAVEALGRLDVWVSNAGVYPVTPLLSLGAEEWDRVVGVNLRGAFLGAREAARAMIALGNGGVILTIASTAAYRVEGPGVSHYAASKFGVRGLTQSLAVELGPHGIRVLAIAPTVTLTPGLDEQREALEASGFALEDLGRSLPLGRVAVPDDVARVAVFCASDLSLLMTGSTLLVDAGELT
jgi:NAD(P)-dependent dehydrogenase (short-subunit alcohol dehydrogenase family)